MRKIASTLSRILSLFLLVSCVGSRETPDEAELLLRAEAVTGEGSIWHPGRQSLFWVDIEGQALHEYLPATGEDRSWRFDRMVSTVVPESDSTVIVALRDEIVRVSLADGSTTSVAPIPDGEGRLRCNDGKCDPSGRLWVGTMCLDAPQGSAALYTVLPDGTVTTRWTGVTISNGIVWSADRRLIYYNDTPTGQIVRFRYDDATGAIEYDGVAARVPEGTGAPDGMTIDSEGNLWVAQWGGAGVYRYDPRTGELLGKVSVPAPNVASCAFGGAGLDTLYITTARAGLDEEALARYPFSGSLFRYVPGVKGVPANYFR